MIDKSVRELSGLIKDRKVKVRDLAEQYIFRIEQVNEHCQALATFAKAGFSLLAESADDVVESDQNVGPLHGIPILVDDLLEVANMRTMFGCQAYSDYIPEVDSMAVRRLRAAGALFPGKTATSELGLIQEEKHNSFVCRSPWGESFVSGGGCSGSAVGLVNHCGAAAIALDVGGNVLLPAAFCGVFAMVPTYGRIPHTPIYSHGLMFASVALLTRDVVDCSLLMDLVSEHSEVDPLSERYSRVDYQAAVTRSCRGVSVALTNELWNAPYDKEHKKAIDRIENQLKRDCRVERKRPPIRNSLDAWETVLCANLFFNHGKRYRQRPDQFGKLASKWITNGEKVSAADYISAQRQIYGLRLLLWEFFKDYDVLIIPAAGCLPFEFDKRPTNISTDNQSASWQQYASMCNIAAISGFPCAHLPMGLSKEGLPIGVLVLAKPGDEDLVLGMCATLEESKQ